MRFIDYLTYCRDIYEIDLTEDDKNSINFLFEELHLNENIKSVIKNNKQNLDEYMKQQLKFMYHFAKKHNYSDEEAAELWTKVGLAKKYSELYRKKYSN